MSDSPRIAMRDRVQALTARTLARLPSRAQLLLAGGAPLVVDGQRMDAQLQLLRAIRQRRSQDGYCEPTVAIGRRRLRHEALVFRGRQTPVGDVRDFTIPGPAGPIPVRHYSPPDAPPAPQPLLVYLHGGGYVIADIDTHDECCRLLCRSAGVHVLSVGYRLAPEHVFPAALDDTATALRWARANAASLGADPGRVALGGDSAGANLAAVESLRVAGSRDAPVVQLLVYPPTDARTSRPSWSLFGTGYFLSLRDRAQFKHYYLEGAGVGSDDPRVSPLLGESLAGAAPALVVTAGFDILRDEGEAYADALRAAGVLVRSWRASSLGHGFVNMTGVCPAARREVERIGRELRGMLDAVQGSSVVAAANTQG